MPQLPGRRHAAAPNRINACVRLHKMPGVPWKRTGANSKARKYHHNALFTTQNNPSTMIQTRKDKQWYDESGNLIPFARLTKLEVMRESEISKILKDAIFINKKLREFKDAVRDASERIVQEFMEQKNLESIGKGNVTLYNFDRSVKVEVSISDRIEFDDLTMKACKEKFDSFLADNVEERQQFIKEMVNDAFSTSRGKLDSKKVMGLLKYESKVKDAKFQEAMTLLKESIRRPDSRTYYRVWLKDGSGEYQNIDLNFSSI
ncbi:MAG: DUF3164 family protein [Methylotenera sp.]|nr:DUF3164 family protein [Methylotenera sp.]